MRMTAHARQITCNTTREVFGADAQVKLFGSRVDDSKRGGDIDLLVQLPRHQPDAHKKSLTLATRLRMQLGDQRIDVLVVDPETSVQPIPREAVATRIPT